MLIWYDFNIQIHIYVKDIKQALPVMLRDMGDNSGIWNHTLVNHGSSTI